MKKFDVTPKVVVLGKILNKYKQYVFCDFEFTECLFDFNCYNNFT